jgi:hypothetical protein
MGYLDIILKNKIRKNIMTTGIPVLVPASLSEGFKILKPVSFARQDNASFDEDLLQRIVDEVPNILPIKDFYPSAKDVRSLGREVPVDLGGGRQGFIDNLLVTNDGHLVVVETKLHRNPEAVREAVIQALEYGMAMQKLSLSDLEARLKRSEETQTKLKHNDTIYSRALGMENMQDDFIAAIEKFLRTGEILLLVVADGIKLSVEHITKWMNENLAGSPLKFGLVELRFYLNADGSKLVVPKTLLKTVEISRHVVVVDIKNNSSGAVQTSVSDDSQALLGSGKSREIKSVELMTKEKLLAAVSEPDKETIQELFNQLESIGYVENTKTASQLRYGLAHPDLSGEFLPVLYFEKFAVWMQPVKALRELIEDEEIFRMRNEMIPAVCFWRPDQILDATSSGIAVRYSALKDKIPEMMRVLEDFKRTVMAAYDKESLD